MSEQDYEVAYVAAPSDEVLTPQAEQILKRFEAKNKELKDSEIKAIKAIKQMENKDCDQNRFCREHGFDLEKMKFYYSSEQLRRAGRIVEKEFNFYITLEE